MARGQNASTGRTARSERGSRSVNAIAEMAKREGLDPKNLSLKQAEQVLFSKTDDYPTTSGHLREIYAEQAFEMRANDITPPSYTRWAKERATVRFFSEKREAEQAKMKTTPEGEAVEKAYKESAKAFDEAARKSSVARYALERATLEKFGDGETNYRSFLFDINRQRFNDGTRFGDKPGSFQEILAQWTEEKFPQEMQRLNEAEIEYRVKLKERQDAGEARRQFLTK